MKELMRSRSLLDRRLRSAILKFSRSSLTSTRGTAVIETALTLPLLLGLLLNSANFGLYIYDWITIDNAARAAAQYQIYSGVAVGVQGTPSIGQIEALVQNEVSSLKNSSNVTVEVCSNDDVTVKCDGTGTVLTSLGPDGSDPEPGYRLYYIDVKYPFTPILPSTLSLLTAQNIERHVFMRSMQ
jgi:Flp pilus assembly protein TadG